MTVIQLYEQQSTSHRMSVEAKADVWRSKSRALKVAEEEEKLARDELIASCNGHDFEGCGVRVEAIERKGVIEYKAIPELAEVNLDSYRKPSTVYWTVKLSVRE